MKTDVQLLQQARSIAARRHYGALPKHLALFDWDGTVSPGFTLLPWCSHLQDSGLLDHSVVVGLAALFEQYDDRRLSHDQLSIASSEIYAKGLAGAAVRDVSVAARAFVDAQRHTMYPFVSGLFAQLQLHGLGIVVISGAPALVLQEYSAELPLQKVFGLELAVDTETSCYTGVVALNPGFSEQKGHIVEYLLAEATALFGFGNSISDLPLLQAAAFGIVLNATKEAFSAKVTDALIFATPENIESLVAGLLKGFGGAT